MPVTNRPLRQRFIAAANQPTAGTFVVLTKADMLIVGDVNVEPLSPEFVERKIEQGFFGAKSGVIVQEGASFKFGSEIVGSGTAGTAPQHGKLMPALGASETVITAHSGTAQSGTANGIRLAAGASATNDAYQGAHISINGGTGAGQERIIIDYTGATKDAVVNLDWTTQPDATSTYTIEAQVVYNPITDNIGQASMVYDKVGIYYKARDLRGNAQFSYKVKDIPSISWDFMGIVEGVTVGGLSGTLPTIPKPAAVTTTNSGLVSLFGVDYTWSEINYDLGAKVSHEQVVGEELIDYDRSASASIVVNLSAAQENDLVTKMRAGYQGPLWSRHGLTAGHRHAHSMPFVQIKNIKEEKIGNRIFHRIELTAPPSSAGNDEWSYTQF